MTENKRFVGYFDKDHNYIIQDLQNEDEYQVGFVNCDEDVFLKLVNKIADENEQLKQDLKDCKKLAGKRLNKNRNHRAVIEDLGGSIRAYKGQISQLNEKIDKIQEAMEDTGALTKRQLEEILND